MRKIPLASLAALAVLLAAPLLAGPQTAVRGFYDEKSKTTSLAAYERAEDRLRRVEVGMSEREFLARMEMRVLRRDGKAVDAMLDGYLPVVSKRVNRDSPCGERAMLFGFVEDDVSQPQVRVTMRDSRVVEVRILPAAVARLQR